MRPSRRLDERGGGHLHKYCQQEEEEEKKKLHCRQIVSLGGGGFCRQIEALEPITERKRERSGDGAREKDGARERE